MARTQTLAGGIRATVTASIGCVSVLVVQCTTSGFVVTVDGQIVHQGAECPYRMDGTDTVVHAWGGRRDAFCMGGDEALTRPQHADLVGFLQRQATDNNDKLCWNGRPAEGSRAAARFFALPVDGADQELGDVARWGAVTKQTDGRLLLSCADQELCPSTDSHSLYWARVSEDRTLLLRMDAEDQVTYADFAASGARWSDTLRWYDWDPEIARCAVCPGSNVRSSVSPEEQGEACNIVGRYGDGDLCTEVPPTLVPNRDVVETQLACIKAQHCDCLSSRFTDLNETEEVSNTCSEVCEVVYEEASHPQLLAGERFARKTGRAEDVQKTGINQLQEAWGAKRVLKVKRTRDERYAGCNGFYSYGCMGAPCDYRLETKYDCKACPLSPQFGLTREGLLGARSPAGAGACSRDCGHTIRTCKFRREVRNWPQLVEYYGSTTQARQEVERAHIEDMKTVAQLRFAQGFSDNPCSRRCAHACA